MKFAQSAFMPICWVAAILSMVFVAQIVTAGRPSSSGAAAAQPSVPAIQKTIDPNLRYDATAEGSILCASPFNVREAVTAKYDAKWIESLNCVRAKSGTPVIMLDYISSIGYKVRAFLPNGEGATLWTNYHPVEYCGDRPCSEKVVSAPEIRRPAPAPVKPETGTSARWVCQKTTIVNRDGSSPTTCGFQTLPEDAK